MVRAPAICVGCHHIYFTTRSRTFAYFDESNIATPYSLLRVFNPESRFVNDEKKGMANERQNTFDPFDLQPPEESGDEATAKARPVLIAVTESGNSEPNNHNGQIHSMDSFDPFGIGALQQEEGERQENAGATLQPPPQVSRVTRSELHTAAAGNNLALPPKVIVKLTLHEEVSSVAKAGKEGEGSSDTSVEGSIYAQVQCSDAKKNAPFLLQLEPSSSVVNLRPNPNFSTTIIDDQQQLVEVPKHEIGYVPVAFYSLAEEVVHMPILVERKVTLHDKSCRLAIQIRSKLDNQGDMQDLTIAVAFPERVDARSVEIIRGDGEWDELKRLVKWKLPALNRGESYMVSAQAVLWKEVTDNEKILFPVLLRCSSSSDQISTVNFKALQADGHPSSITYQKTQSFRLLHRLT